MPELYCLGLTTLDIAVRSLDTLPRGEESRLVEAIELSAAGTAGGTALIAARLGLSTGLLSAVGNDRQGILVQQELAAEGVDLSGLVVDPERPTSTTVLAIGTNGQRPNVHQVGASAFMKLNEADERRLTQTRFLHFGAVGFPKLQGDEVLALLARLRQHGCFICCDLIAPSTRACEHLEALLPQIDLLMPSEAEVRTLRPDLSLKDAARALTRAGAGQVLIKRGAAGVAGWIEGEWHQWPAFPITPVDTTSCGDAFCAGVLSGLAANQTLAVAVRRGIATASFVAEGMGTLGKLATMDAVDNRANTLYG